MADAGFATARIGPEVLAFSGGCPQVFSGGGPLLALTHTVGPATVASDRSPPVGASWTTQQLNDASRRKHHHERYQFSRETAITSCLPYLQVHFSPSLPRLLANSVRRKKTRCPGEKPACSSCVRLKQSCSYPPAIRPSQSGPSVRLYRLPDAYYILTNYRRRGWLTWKRNWISC